MTCLLQVSEFFPFSSRNYLHEHILGVEDDFAELGKVFRTDVAIDMAYGAVVGRYENFREGVGDSVDGEFDIL